MPNDSRMSPKASTREEAIRVIAALGGTNAVAALCDVAPASVSGWKKNGIPQARMQFLRLLRPDLFDKKKR
jgi:hypothetical protein